MCFPPAANESWSSSRSNPNSEASLPYWRQAEALQAEARWLEAILWGNYLLKEEISHHTLGQPVVLTPEPCFNPSSFFKP